MKKVLMFCLLLIIYISVCGDTTLILGTRIIPGPFPPNLNSETPEYVEYKNIDYAGDGNPKQMQDVFYPIVCEGQLKPVVIWIHGGGWNGGSRYMTDPEFIFHKLLLQMGYAIVLMDYRLIPEVDWNNQFDDVKKAIIFIKNNSETYGFDKNKIVVAGHSAGAQLALMAGAINDLDEDGEKDVLTVVGLSAPTDIELLSNHYKQLLCKNKNCYQDLSPIYHLNNLSAPSLLLHGQYDSIFSLENLYNYYKYSNNNNYTTIKIIDNGNHVLESYNGYNMSFPSYEDLYLTCIKHISKFVDDTVFFGDVNFDNIINQKDLILLENQLGNINHDLFGKHTEWNPLADLVLDGVIDIKDHKALVRHIKTVSHFPINIKVNVLSNNSLLQNEYILSLIWEDNPNNKVNNVYIDFYKIYKKNDNLSVPVGDTKNKKYFIHNFNINENTIYGISAIDINGKESSISWTSEINHYRFV